MRSIEVISLLVFVFVLVEHIILVERKIIEDRLSIARIQTLYCYNFQ